MNHFARDRRRRPALRWLAAPLLAGAAAAAPWSFGCGTTGNVSPPAPATQVSAPSEGRPAPGPSPVLVAAREAKPPARRLLSPGDVDAVVAEGWTAAHVTPVAAADDSEFLRRIMLDIAGRIPTLGEAEAFSADARAGDKRTRLVDAVLGSGDYAEHSANICVDLFIGRQFRKPQLEKRLDPRAYFAAAFRENRSFDRIAREMLTFTGEIQPSGPGVFLASHLKGGGPEMAAAVTARLFTGVQISCAQCHDHPTDLRYKQEDFYGLVAYFAGTKSREEKKRPGETGSPVAAAAVTAPVTAGPTATATMDDAAPNAAMVAAPETAKGATKAMAADKSYFIQEKGSPWPSKIKKAKFKKVGAEDETVVSPKFMGRDVAPLPGETPRDTLARALVESDLFAKAMVNRTWARLLGRGIIEPWDDLGGEGDPRHPVLLNVLAKDFRDSGFDVKHLVRTIVLSRAYGLTSRVPPKVAATKLEPGAPPAGSDADAADTAAAGQAAAAFDATSVFARATVRRMTPEQLFRSILVATGADHMERSGTEDMEKKLERLMREHLFVFGDDEMAEIDTFNGNIPQALLMFNGEVVNQGARSRPGGTLASIFKQTPDAAGRLARMFMAAYARPPTRLELEQFLPIVTADNKSDSAAYEDLFFALLTSTEMQTIH